MSLDDITEYLTDEQKQEIAEDIFRERVAAALDNDVKITNFLYRMHREIVQDVMVEKMGDEWVDKVYEHTKKSIAKLSSFDLFRPGSQYYGDVEGPGRKHLIEAVEKHSARIEGRVLRRIEELDDSDLGDLLRSALATRLGGEAK